MYYICNSLIFKHMEQWEIIKQFPNYAVSNLGRVKNINKKVEIILKPCKQSTGYLYVSFYNGPKRANQLIHRLVAAAFIQSDQNRPFINHIDGNKQNNVVENLEYCTHQENIDHSIKTGLKTKKPNLNQYGCNPSSKAVNQYSLSGELINTFVSVRFAMISTGIDQASINKVCKGQRNHAGKFIWRYV